MKEYMDCAYQRGYEVAVNTGGRPWTVLASPEDEQLLVAQIPCIHAMFEKATGHRLPTATEDDIKVVLKWWAKGYCKGRTGTPEFTPSNH